MTAKQDQIIFVSSGLFGIKMLKTRRYKVVWDGRLKFVGFDRLYIDPMTSERMARRAVDDSEVRTLKERYENTLFTEATFLQWQFNRMAYHKALDEYRKKVAEYARQNPIHFEPREGEEIICPLIEQAK